MSISIYILLFVSLVNSIEISMNNCQEELLTINYYSSHINVRIQDLNANDLLNPRNITSYTLSDIRFFNGDTFNNRCYISKHIEEDYYYLKISLQLPKITKRKENEYLERSITKIKIGNIALKVLGVFKVVNSKGCDEHSYGSGEGYTIILQQAWIKDRKLYDINDEDSQMPILILPQK